MFDWLIDWVIDFPNFYNNKNTLNGRPQQRSELPETAADDDWHAKGAPAGAGAFEKKENNVWKIDVTIISRDVARDSGVPRVGYWFLSTRTLYLMRRFQHFTKAFQF